MEKIADHKFSNAYSTNAAILENLAIEGYEIATLVLEWRKVSKLISTISS